MSKPPKTFRDMVIALLKSSGEHHRPPPPMPLGYRRNRHHFKAIFPEPDHIDLKVAIEPPAQNHHHHIDMNQAPKKPYHHHQHQNIDHMHQDLKKPYQNHQHHNIDHIHRDPKKPYHNHQHHNIDMHQDPKKPYQNHQNHIDMHQDPKKPYRNHDMHQDPMKPRQKHQQQHVKDPKKPYQMNVNLDVNVNYLDVKKEPYSRSSSSGSHRRLDSACAYCLWALLFLLLTATFLSVTGAILYFWLQPRAPDFRVVHVNMTDVRLESWNRNDAFGFAYGPVRVGVYAPGKEVVLLSAPGFALAPNSVTVVEAGAEAEAEAEAAAVTPEERMVVEVRAECQLAVDVGGSDAGVYPIKVVCAGLEVGMVESESEPESGCDVYLYGWMLIRRHKRI